MHAWVSCPDSPAAPLCSSQRRGLLLTGGIVRQDVWRLCLQSHLFRLEPISATQLTFSDPRLSFAVWHDESGLTLTARVRAQVTTGPAWNTCPTTVSTPPSWMYRYPYLRQPLEGGPHGARVAQRVRAQHQVERALVVLLQLQAALKRQHGILFRAHEPRLSPHVDSRATVNHLVY